MRRTNTETVDEVTLDVDEVVLIVSSLSTLLVTIIAVTAGA